MCRQAPIAACWAISAHIVGYYQRMRKLIGSALGVVLLLCALSGCAFLDPRIDGTPTNSATDPFSSEYADQAENIHSAWESVAVLKSDPTAAKWAEMSATLYSQWLVLTGPDPVHRVAATGTEPETVPGSYTSFDDVVQHADEALVTARDSALTLAGSSTGLYVGFWASLGASLEQVRLGLTGPYDQPIAPDPARTIETTGNDEALTALIDRYTEGVFAIKAALGFLDDSGPDWPQFQTVLSTLEKDLSDLNALAASQNIAVDPAGLYELPSGRDRDTSLQLLSGIQTSLVDAAAVWASSAADPTDAATYLMHAATLAMPYGIGTAVWPGWPD